MSFDEVKTKIDEINRSGISTVDKIKQLQALQKQAENTADALDKVLVRLSNSLLKLQEQKKKEDSANKL
jgi:hypothetical protein